MNGCFPRLRAALLFFAIALSLFDTKTVAQNISLVGQSDPFPSSHKYGDVWAENDIACVGAFSKYTANPSYGVAIFSITNPAAPVLLANYNPNPSGNSQYEQGVVRNRIGYFASWSGTNGGLHILSLTNPASPLLLSTISKTNGTTTNGFERVHTMFIDGNFLYLADHLTTTVKVFNISNPALPVFVRNIVATDTNKIHQITVANNRLFTSGWGGRTDIYDVSDVANQAPLLGYIDSGSQSHSTWPTTNGNYLVSCREISGGDVRIYNISNPATPSLVTTLTTAGVGIEAAIPHNPVVIGNFLYLSWYQAGLQIFDISNPALPIRVGSYDTFPGAISTAFEGNWGVYPKLGIDKILLSDMQSGLLVMDASAVLTATNFAPILLTQPTSQIVTQGNALTFSATASGSAPLSYQWRLNGASIAGATTNSFILNDVRSTNGGAYTLVVTNSAGSITSSIANLSVFVPETYETIFSDDFETNSSARWAVYPGSGTGNDYTTNWAYNYGTYFSTYNNSTIPSAPNSAGGTTHGLRLTVNNNDTTAAIAGVSLYPVGQTFSNAYKLKFDMWMNYPGGIAGVGSTGSTENSTFGINHAGTRVNWDSATSSPSDGVWFSVMGEGGGSRDYRAYVGATAARPTLFSFAASGLAASGATTDENSDSYFQATFPSPAYETAGSPGKHWVEVEVAQDTNRVVTWKMNGSLIAQRTNTSVFTNGTIMIGYMDLFSSIASPAADAFVIFDNVRVLAPAAAVAPTILSQPPSQTILPEAIATFSVAASGTAPLTYQWRFNGTDISGATDSIYSFSAEPEHEGNYSVFISNSAGTVVSSNAILALINSAEISNISASPGKTTALIRWTTTSPADSQVEYDLHDSQPALLISGKTSRVVKGHGNYNNVSYLDPDLVTEHSILLTGLAPGEEYGFQVISQDGKSRFLSAGYHFTTVSEDYSAPVLVSSPASTVKTVGTALTFSASVSGEPYLLYQWQKNGSNLSEGSNISGSRSDSLTFTSLAQDDAGSYRVVVSNEFGSVTSAVATLTIVSSPVISVQPGNQTGFVGATVAFAVEADGDSPLFYQWKKNGLNVNGGTGSVLTLTNLQSGDAGNYHVVVSNSFGAVTSETATLTVMTSAIPGLFNTGVDHSGAALPNGSTDRHYLLISPNSSAVPFVGRDSAWLANDSVSAWITPALSSGVPAAQSAGTTIYRLTFDLSGLNPASADISGSWCSDNDGMDILINGISTGQTRPAAANAFTFFAITNGLLSGLNTLDFKVRNVLVGTTKNPTGLRVQISGSAAFGGSTPAITMQPKLFLAPGATHGLLQVVTDGGEPLGYHWRANGIDLPGAIAASVSITNPLSAAAYDVVVTNSFGSVTSAAAVLISTTMDSSAPGLDIAIPKSNERLTNVLTAQLAGTASDVGLGIAGVSYRLNYGNPSPVNGATNWNALLRLRPGTNVVEVKAVDFAGNVSAKTLTFFAVIQSQFTLGTNGFGSILAATSSLGTPTNHALLEVGRPYTLNAAPGFNRVLSNWTGTVGYTNVSKLTFVMQSNMTLTANFIVNPFVSVAGKYNGLFFRTNGVSHESSGFLALKLGTNGAFSGKISTDGDDVSFSGKVHFGGDVSLPVSRAAIGKTDLAAHLIFDLASGSDSLTGAVSGLNWNAPLSADRNVWEKSHPATAYTNSYTMLLPGFANSANGPSGYSYGIITVKTNGTLVLAGGMADNHKLKQTVPISKDGQWPFYAPLYSSQRIYTNLTITDAIVLQTNFGYYLGSAIGWLSFSNHAPTGIVSWIKLGWTNSTYPNGFTNNTTPVLGSRYSPPANDAITNAVAITNGTITLSGGNLPIGLARNVLITNKNKVIITPTNNLVQLKLTPKTGAIKGTFIPSYTNSPETFYGVLLQQQRIGGGYFIGTNQAGKVLLQKN